jgi:hypothetical protein
MSMVKLQLRGTKVVMTACCIHLVNEKYCTYNLKCWLYISGILMHCTTKYTGWPSSINNGTFFDAALASLNCSIAETLDCTCKCNDAYIIKEQSGKTPE